MKLKYITGVLVLLVLMVGTASASTTFYLTETTDDYNYGVPIKVQVDYDSTANTLTLNVIDPQNKAYTAEGYTISNVDLKNIYIKAPKSAVSVISPTKSDGTAIWYAPVDNSGSVGDFGTFATQISKSNKEEYKSPGPVVIQLSGVTLDDLLASSGDGYVIAVHVGFDKNSDTGIYTDCSGKVRGHYDIPEFPTIALPIAAILGLMFIFGRRNQK